MENHVKTLPIIWLALFLNTVISHQSFYTTPGNHTAMIGETVVLHCGVNNKTAELQWTKDGFGLGLPADLDHVERYSMQISNDNVHFDLEIRNVNLEDEGIFQCQVAPGIEDREGLRSENAVLNVNVPASYPIIIQGDQISVQENQESQLDCISRGAKPAAKVLWIDYNGYEVTEGVQVIQTMLEDEKRFDTRSTLRFVGNQNLQNRTFTCKAYNSASIETMTANVRVYIVYPPVVWVEIVPLVIQEFGQIDATCNVNASPPATTYEWQMNGVVLDEQRSNSVTVTNISRKFHRSLLTCLVENNIGRSAGHHIISVLYGPMFRIRPTDVHAEIGNSFVLYCESDGNPSPFTVWIHEASNTIVHHGNNYTKRLTHHNHGTYICQAQVPGYAPISAKANVYIKGPPKIVSKAVQLGSKETNVSIECVAESSPLPFNVSWLRFGENIPINKTRYDIRAEISLVGMRSVLLIYDAKEGDFGEYKCTAINFYGQDTVLIYLLEKESGKYFKVIVVIAVSITLAVACCCICFMCLLNSKKTLDGKKPWDVESGENVAEISCRENQGSCSAMHTLHDDDLVCPIVTHERKQQMTPLNTQPATHNRRISLCGPRTERCHIDYINNCVYDGFSDVVSAAPLPLLTESRSATKLVRRKLSLNNNLPRCLSPSPPSQVISEFDSIVFKTQKERVSQNVIDGDYNQPQYHSTTTAQDHVCSSQTLSNTKKLDISTLAAAKVLTAKQSNTSLSVSSTSFDASKAVPKKKYTDDNQQPISFKASASSSPTQNAVLSTQQAISAPEDVLKPGVFACLANSIMTSRDEVDAYDSPKAISGETETERCKLLQEIRTGTSLKRVQISAGVKKSKSSSASATCKEKPDTFGEAANPSNFVRRSFTLGPTDGLGQAIAHAIQIRNKSVNPESSSSSSSYDNGDQSFTDEDWK